MNDEIVKLENTQLEKFNSLLSVIREQVSSKKLNFYIGEMHYLL